METAQIMRLRYVLAKIMGRAEGAYKARAVDFYEHELLTIAEFARAALEQLEKKQRAGGTV